MSVRAAGPSPDSLKTPIVLLAFDAESPLWLNKETRDLFAAQPSTFLDFFPPLEGRSDDGDYVYEAPISSGPSGSKGRSKIGLMPGQHILEFSLVWNSDHQYLATFKLWDPTFQLLDLFASMRSNSLNTVSVYYQYGWIVDGTTRALSPLREARFIDADVEIAGDGMILSIACQSTATHERTIQKANCSFDAGIPFHDVIRVLIESNPEDLAGGEHFTAAECAAFAVKSLSNPNRTPRLDASIELEPLWNNKQPLILTMQDSILPWINARLMQGGLPADPALRNRRPFLYESASAPGVFYLACEGRQPNAQNASGASRTYHVGRTSNANVLSFLPRDTRKFANQLGGFGATRGIDAYQPKGEQVIESLRTPVAETGVGFVDKAIQSITEKVFTYMNQYARSRDTQTLEQQRQALWNNARILAVEADLEILGDPFIDIMDTLDIFTYYGGTLSLMGRYRDSMDARQSELPTVYPGLSAQWNVVGFEQHIAGGKFETKLYLYRSMNSLPEGTSQIGTLPGAKETPPDPTSHGEYDAVKALRKAIPLPGPDTPAGQNPAVFP